MIIWVFLIAILGALAGDEHTSLALRRLLIPSILAVLLHNPLPLLLILVFSIGYGIPDKTDEGSPLGRLAYSISRDYADYITRGILALTTGCVLGKTTGICLFAPYLACVGLLSVWVGKHTTTIKIGQYGLLWEDLIYWLGVGSVLLWR